MGFGHVYLVSRGYIFRINLDKLSRGTPPSVELVVDFLKEGLPIGMGMFSLNSKIYLVGGEMIGKYKTLSRVNRLYVLDLDYGDEGVSSRFYAFNPSSLGKHFSSFSSDIPAMIGAKGKPKIATIDGKVYVLGTNPHCASHKISHPAFECYDPSCGRWEELPEPPHYRDERLASRMGASVLRSFFVFGRKIYIKNSYGLSFFDGDAREWKDMACILGEDTHNSPSLPSYNRLEEMTSVAEGENGLVIAYTLGGLKAYLYGVDGILRLEQRLGQIDDNFGLPEYSDGFVCFLGDERFCLVLSAVMAGDICWGVRVTIFTVNVQGDTYIEALILNSKEYDFSLRVPDSECFKLYNVLIAKGGGEELEDPLVVGSYDHWFTFPISGPLPKPRSEHAAAVIENQMYILGGAQDGIYLNDLHALDMSRWTWSKVSVKGSGETASPVRVAPCVHHSLIPWGVDKLLLIAGDTKVPSETIEVKLFDLRCSTWSTLKTWGKPPVSRGGQSVNLDGKRLIVFGGEDAKGGLLNDVHILDLGTLTWGEIDASGLMPSPRMDHAAAVHAGSYLFIFGGRSHTACFNDLHVLDLQTMQWTRPTQQGEIPSPRAGHAGVVIQENWFIAGGGDEQTGGVPDTVVLDMSTVVWSSVGGSGYRLGSKGLSLVLGSCRGQRLLVSFGGRKYTGKCTNEVNVLKPRCKLILGHERIF